MHATGAHHMNVAVDVNIMGKALIRSFENWTSKAGHSSRWKKVPNETRQVVVDALCEIEILKPGCYDSWWALNHNRYIRQPGVRQIELRIVHTLMYYFLTAFARGELDRGALSKPSAIEGGQTETIPRSERNKSSRGKNSKRR